MSSKRICVIEDSKPIRRLFCTLLQKSGFETFDFEDGVSSLEWLDENTVDVILMDILLPDINGTELLKRVRNIDGYQETPVIAVTGFATANDKEKYLSQGFDSYMSKPVNTATFVKDVNAVLDSSN